MRVTIVDTIRAVSLMITRTFNSSPTTKDIHEGFTRPCTYVQPILMQSEKNGTLVTDTFGMQIIRFATKSETGYLELLTWQETLREALEQPIAVYTAPTTTPAETSGADPIATPPQKTEFMLFPEEILFEIDRDDMALIVSFTIQNAQIVADPEETAAETMQNIEYKAKAYR